MEVRLLRWTMRMCNRYEYEGALEQIAADYEALAVGELQRKSPVYPRYIAPALIKGESGYRQLHPMQFAFSTPGMSTAYHPKKTRNNARIESAHIPPWRNAFKAHRCVIPLDAFHEPCYWGPTAKQKVYFHRPDSGRLHAAGIYRVWSPPEGGPELYTMSMLIGPARDYVMEHGHHRQPIFIDESGIDSWLDPTELATADCKEILREYFEDPELVHTIDSPLTAATWKKNLERSLADKQSQLEELAKSRAVCGF